MKIETLSDSDYVQVGLSLIEKSFLPSGKVCEIIDENAMAPHICEWTATDAVRVAGILLLI